MTVIINKQIIRRLHGLYDSLNNFTSKINEIKKHKNGLTISLANFVERAIKNKSIGLNINKSVNNTINYFMTDTENNNDIENSEKKENINTLPTNENINSNLQTEGKNKMFSVAKKVENNFFFSDDEISLYESDNSSDDLCSKGPSINSRNSVIENFDSEFIKNKEN